MKKRKGSAKAKLHRTLQAERSSAGPRKLSNNFLGFPKGKRGAIEFGMKFLIGLILTIAFFMLAYMLIFTDLGPRTADAANYYVFSKVGITVSPEKMAQISSAAGFMGAKITAEPPSPVCNLEPVYFSANSTTLPKGITLDKVNCYWDFDLSSEPTRGICSTSEGCDAGFFCKSFGACISNNKFCSNDGDCPSHDRCNITGGICAAKGAGSDGDATNDYESANCYATNHSGPWAGAEGKRVKLEVIYSDKKDNTTAVIKSSLFCACATSGACQNEPNISPPLETEIYDSNAITISFKSTWELADFHMILEPVGEAKDLKIDVDDDGTADYSFGGNLTNPTVVYGFNLVRAIEQVRATCMENSVNPCPVPFVFYFKDRVGAVKVKEVWIPLSST